MDDPDRLTLVKWILFAISKNGRRSSNEATLSGTQGDKLTRHTIRRTKTSQELQQDSDVSETRM